MATVWTAVALATGCGGSAHDRTIITVAGVPIGESLLRHWVSLTAPRQGAPEPPRFKACIDYLRELVLRPSRESQLEAACRRQYGELTQSALHLLITDRWFIGDAADRGTPISESDVDRRLHEKYGSPEGRMEYEALLGIGGHTAADVRLEVKVELAATSLRERLRVYSLEVPSSQVMSYYRHNLGRFRVAEQRAIEVVGNVKERSRITDIMDKVRHGTSFSSLSFHESLERPDFSSLGREKRIFYLAAFRATPTVLMGPLRIDGFYFLFEVTHVAPVRVRSLGEATPAIRQQLSSARRVSFVTRWRRKWIAQTSCIPAYVVQKCKQAHIPRQYAAPEDPLEVN